MRNRTLHSSLLIALLIPGVFASAQPVPSLIEWTGLAGDEARSGVRPLGIPAGGMGAPRWVRSVNAQGQLIRFNGPAGLAAVTLPQARVFASAVINSQAFAVCLDAEDGQVVWTTPIPALQFGSWTTPALDPEERVVLLASSSSLLALRTSDGSQAWRHDFNGLLVNASPLVLRDLPGRHRVYMTDYGGFGGPTSLACINLSPRHPTLNPFDPGQLLWSVPTGSSNGASPAALSGVVYVTSSGLDAGGAGEIRAFDAGATAPPTPLWTFTNPRTEGFFGGLCVREQNGNAFVFAASYAFDGGLDSSNLVKVNARTGGLIWSVNANRTASIPVVLDDGRIALATGLQGFGSVPTVQLFRDDGASAVRLWGTAESTWIDANANSILDPGEFLLAGGWTTHGAVTRTQTLGGVGTPRMLVGAIAGNTETSGAYTRLFEFDLNRVPSDSNFIGQQTTSAGSTPAMLGAGVYSVGTGGLAAFGPAPPRADLTGDASVSIDDLYAWEQGLGPRDVDRSGTSDGADRAFLLFELRRNEARDCARGCGRVGT